MEQISFLVTTREDESVQIGVTGPATVGVAGHSTFHSVVALERALERVGLPRSLARATEVSMPLPVSLVQLSRLGFL